MPGLNVICGVKFGRFWTFDRRRPSWILIKMKNFSAALFLVSSSMSMPDLIQIEWTGSERLAEMWFAGWNLAAFGPLTAGGHLGFWKKWKIRLQPCFYCHAWFGPNRMNRIQVIPKTFILLGPPPSFPSCDKAVHRALRWELKNRYSMNYFLYGSFKMSEV